MIKFSFDVIDLSIFVVYVCNMLQLHMGPGEIECLYLQIINEQQVY
jgi:hypothetical protein